MPDDDGYPTFEELEAIRTWKGEDWHQFMALVHDAWWMPQWGWRQEGTVYRISTGGWSGNEDLINSMAGNDLFWTLCWQESRRGGHFTFRVPIVAESGGKPPLPTENPGR